MQLVGARRRRNARAIRASLAPSVPVLPARPPRHVTPTRAHRSGVLRETVHLRCIILTRKGHREQRSQIFPNMIDKPADHADRWNSDPSHDVAPSGEPALIIEVSSVFCNPVPRNDDRRDNGPRSRCQCLSKPSWLLEDDRQIHVRTT